MTIYRILIVDDQPDVRAVLKSGIETLSSDFDVVAVPSGEEALLEISSQSFDLMVSDVHLPGITGLELVAKLRKRNTTIKVILVTGMVDAQVRRSVADAGVDAFFLKPIEVADFLDAVERSLGLIEAAPLDQEIVIMEKPAENVSARLADLRQELDAISAVILDDRGRALVRAGDLPDASVETALFPALMAAFSASERVANHLVTSPPNDLMYFAGSKYDIFQAHVGTSYALVIALNPLGADDKIDERVQIVRTGVQDLLNLFKQMGVTLTSTKYVELQEDEIVFEDAEDAPLIEALFKGEPAFEEVDAFWDTASQDSKQEITNADALSFEQAQQLGLTPAKSDEG